MRAIHKFRLPFMEIAEIAIPIGAQVVRCDGLDGALWIWAIVDTDNPTEIRTFHLFKTGAAMPLDMNLEYLGCGAIFIQMELMMYIFQEIK